MPTKRKNQPRAKKTRRGAGLKKTLVAVPEAPAQAAPSFNGASSEWTLFLLGIFVVLWGICWAGHYQQAEKVFLVISILICASYFLNLSNPKHALILIGLGWVMTGLAIGSNPNFIHVFSIFKKFNLPNPATQFAIGMGLLVAFWRFLKPLDPAQDISKNWARFWFWIILAVAFYFRMYKIHEAAGIYWDDCAVSIVDARGILEFKERPMLMPIANREPFYCYSLAALWSFIPNAYAIFIHRLGGGLIDLGAVWLFYLVGKEVGGRRVGLVAAALGAVNKPMIIGAFTGNSNVTAPMAVALILLTTLRLFKNPNWKHFVWWGLSLGFAPYNYTSVRPWLLFIVTAVFLWIWFYREKGGKVKWDYLLGWGTFLAWAFCFLMVNNFLPKQSGWVSVFSRSGVGILALVLFWFFFLQALRSSRETSDPVLVPRFFLGVFLAALAIYPLAVQPLIAAHASGLSIFHSHDNLAVHFGADSFKVFFEKIADSLHILFIGGEDRGDMNLSGDAFFDYHFIPVFILGLVSLLVQPNWIKGFLLISGLVGISPHILSIDPHSGKFACCVAPLAVLAGMGVQQVYQALKYSFSGARSGFLIFVFFIGYFCWAMVGSSDRVLNTFFTGDRVEKTVSNQVRTLSGSANVYIASYPLFVSGVVQAVLDQGFDVYSMKKSNPIFLKPGEKTRNAVVLFHLYDKETEALVTREFKNVTWDVIYLGGWPDKRVACRRAIIPAAEITSIPGGMFYFQTVPETNWTRDYLMGRYILGYGVIELEESRPSPFDPIANAMGGRLVNVRGQFNLPNASRLSFKVNTNDFVRFQIDGQQLIYQTPDWKPILSEKTVKLGEGIHQVTYDIWLQHDQTIPQVVVSVDGGFYAPMDTLSRNNLSVPAR